MPVSDDVTGRGVARRARTDARLAEVVREQLAEHGYAGLTIEKVAAASGVAKTTIYRRWASKAEMVFDIAIHNADRAPLPDTGKLANDVRALAERAVALVSGQPGRSVLPGLLADMAGDETLTERLRTTSVAVARDDIAAALNRAVDRGELEPGADVDEFHAALLGIPYASVHLLGIVDAARLTDSLARQLLALLSAPRPS